MYVHFPFIYRPTLDSCYSNICFPYESSVSTSLYPHKVNMPLKDFLLYLRTFSAYRSLLTKVDIDPIDVLETNMLQADKDINIDSIIEVEFQFFAVTALKPE